MGMRGTGSSASSPHHAGNAKEAKVAESARRFADEVEASGARLTTADIQRHLMKHKKDLDRALEELPALLKSMKAEQATREANQPASEASSPEKPGCGRAE